MKIKNRAVGILISTGIISALALTGIFDNTVRGTVILVVLILGLFTLVPYMLEKLSNRQKG